MYYVLTKRNLHTAFLTEINKPICQFYTHRYIFSIDLIPSTFNKNNYESDTELKQTIFLKYDFKKASSLQVFFFFKSKFQWQTSL